MSNLSEDNDSRGGRLVGDGCRCYWDLRQLGTTTTGIFIFLSAGMNMAQSFGWPQINADHFRYSWFIGVTVGTFLTLLLRHFVLEKLIMAASAILIFIEGVIYLIPHSNTNALLAGRYLNGIAVGLVILTFLVHTSEISLNANRGVLLGIEQYSLAVGISIQMIYSAKWNPLPVIRLHGIFDIIFAVLAFASIWIFVESPIKYFRRGNDAAALDCLDRLHRSQGWKVTTDIIFKEFKNYVREQLDLSWLESLRLGALPLLKMIFFRSMVLPFSFSLPLFTVLQRSTTIIWPQLVAACLRILGCFLAYRLVDKFGRKLPSLVSIAAIGAIILSIAIVCQTDGNVFNSYEKFIVASLCLLAQFFGGLFAPFTSVYMGEAFPLRVKPYLMAVCIIVEHLIHIIVIYKYGGIEDDNILLAEGILILVSFVGLCVTMPETKKTSLRGALELFTKLIHLKLYQHY